MHKCKCCDCIIDHKEDEVVNDGEYYHIWCLMPSVDKCPAEWDSELDNDYDCNYSSIKCNNYLK